MHLQLFSAFMLCIKLWSLKSNYLKKRHFHYVARKQYFSKYFTMTDDGFLWRPKRVALHHSFHYVVCPTTGPQSLPKQVLHSRRSSASFFSISYILCFSQGRPAAYNVFFLAFPSLLSFPLNSLQKRVLEGSSHAVCGQSSWPHFFLLSVGYSYPPWLF